MSEIVQKVFSLVRHRRLQDALLLLDEHQSIPINVRDEVPNLPTVGPG